MDPHIELQAERLFDMFLTRTRDCSSSLLFSAY